MKIRTNIKHIAIGISSFLPMAASAQLTLSGATVYYSQPDGEYAGTCGWNTRGGDSGYNLYLFTGQIASPVFLNSADTDGSLDPKLELSLGTYTIQFAGASDCAGNDIGLNLYFNSNLASNRITAVVPHDGSGHFSVVSRGIPTVGEDGGDSVEPSSGSLSFTSGKFTVILTDFRTIPSPGPDLVSAFSTGQDGGADTVGSFTLLVVPSDRLLDIRVSQVELCWQTATNTWYQLQYRSSLTTNQWVPLFGTWIAGDGGRYCTNDAVLVGSP